MSDVALTRTGPTENAAAFLLRRFRESPVLAAPLVAAAAAVALRVVAPSRFDPRWRIAEILAPVGVAIVAAVASIGSDRRRRQLGAADDDPQPVRVRWLDAPPGAGDPQTERQAHLLPGALRVVARRASRPDMILMVLLAAASVPAMGWFGPLAALAICWAFGLPRHDRVSAEVPWGEVAEVVRSGREHFRIRRAAEQGDLVLEARYSQKDRLEERLRPLVGERFRVDLTGQDTALRPAVLRPAPGDEDRGILELIVRRGGWPLASGLGCLGIAFALYVARHLSGIAELERAAMGLLILGIVLTSVGRRRNANLWSGHVPQDGDAPDPVPVKWRNRPGLPGPGPQHVHVVPDMLRVVALEWEPWDVCVGVAAVLVTVPLAIRVFWLPLAILGVLGSVGLPRKRRYVVELPWSAITHVRIQGPKFVVSSDLPAPADLVRVEAPYSAGARLAAALRERLGDRVEIEGA